MAIRDRKHRALLAHDDAIHSRDGLGAEPQRDVELARRDEPHEHAGVVLPRADPQAGQRVQSLLGDVVGPRGEPEPQDAELAAGGVRGGVGRADGGAGRVEHRPAGVGQLDAVR